MAPVAITEHVRRPMSRIGEETGKPLTLSATATQPPRFFTLHRPTGATHLKARLRPLFRQERVAASAWKFLDGLLGNEPRKTGWMRAEAAGDPGPWRQQAVLGRGRWHAEALRDIVGDYALETLADAEAVLSLTRPAF